MPEEMTKMPARPGFDYRLNLNSVILLIGLIGGGVSWGISWQTLKAAQERNADAIAGNTAKIAEISQAMKTYADLPYRVAALESRSGQQATDQKETAAALQQLATNVQQLASDMRVTRVILERLDRSTRDVREPPP